MVLTQSVALVEFFDKTENYNTLSLEEGQRLCPRFKGASTNLNIQSTTRALLKIDPDDLTGS